MVARLAAQLATGALTPFALVDGARDRGIRRRLAAFGFSFQSLYDGAGGEELAPFGPYLVQLPKDPYILHGWLRDCWGNSHGIHLASDADLPHLRTHFRKFLIVQLDARKAYFRFYDPRVLRVFLPQCTFAEWIQFFGPIDSFFVESHDGSELLKFRRDADEPEPEVIELTE